MERSGRVDQCVLRWFGHVERMDEGQGITLGLCLVLLHI